MDRTDSIRRHFGAAASRYAASTVHRAGPDLDALVRAAALSGREQVLDLGCGAGHTAVALAERAREVVAIDVTPAMLAETRRLAASRGLSNVRCERGDACALPFESGSFDVVSSRLSAHHYARPAVAAAEAARVLRPGGSLLLVDVVAPEEPGWDTFLNAVELLRDPSHVRDHTVGQWREILRGAGLSAEVLGTWHHAIDFEDWVERMATPPGAIEQLRAMFDGAPDDVRSAFGIGPDHSFRLEFALLRGTRAASVG